MHALHRRSDLAQRGPQPRQQPLAGDFRTHSPRFQGEALAHNLGLVEKLRAFAEARNATPVQVAIAWVAAQGDDIVPLIGARRPERLAEALGAANQR